MVNFEKLMIIFVNIVIIIICFFLMYCVVLKVFFFLKFWFLRMEKLVLVLLMVE